MEIQDDFEVKLPKFPTLSEKTQIFISDGLLLYGGSIASIYLEGKNNIKDTLVLLNELRKNTLNSDEFKTKIIKLHNRDNYIYILQQLSYYGFLADRSAKTDEEKYLDELNQVVKKYNHVDEIMELKQSLKINISSNNIQLYTKLKKLFIEEGFMVVESEDYDWRIYEIDQLSNLDEIDQSKRTFVFSNTSDGLIIGPIISKDLIKKIDFNYFKNKKNLEDFSNEMAYSIFLMAMKSILKLTTINFSKGLIINKNYSSEFVSFLDISGDQKLNIIDKYEFLTAFSSNNYFNEPIKIAKCVSKNNFISNFWKKTKFSSPTGMEEIFISLGGFQEENSNEKCVNSNVLLYINLDKKDLNGIGIYYYDNIANLLYQIDDDIGEVNKAFNINCLTRGYLILGSDVDFLKYTYYDSSFKTACINIGMQVGKLFSTNIYKHTKKLSFISIYDERVLRNSIGATFNNLIFNVVMEVKND